MCILLKALEECVKGRLYAIPVFDGQYGTISVYSAHERDEILNGVRLIEVPKKNR